MLVVFLRLVDEKGDIEIGFYRGYVESIGDGKDLIFTHIITNIIQRSLEWLMLLSRECENILSFMNRLWWHWISEISCRPCDFFGYTRLILDD